jgi:hypothetical protein
LAEYAIRWWILVDTVMNLRVPYKTGNLMSNRKAIGLLNGILSHLLVNDELFRLGCISS